MPKSDNKDLAGELEVIAGNPTENELAAVLAVLRESASSIKATQDEVNWAKGPQMLRDGSNTGDLEWRSDFKGEI
jgi:hypothetical protein